MDSNDPIVARLQRDTQRSMEAVLDMVRYRQMIVVETREQIAREDEKAGDSYVCPRLPHPAGMESCDYCSGVQDGFYLAAAIARGEK